MSYSDGNTPPCPIRDRTICTGRGWSSTFLQVVAASLAVALIACPAAAVAGESAAATVALIPQPTRVSINEGRFVFRPETTIECGRNARSVARLLQAQLSRSLGYPLPIEDVAERSQRQGRVVLKLATEAKELGKEGYRLVVTADQVTITAGTKTGLFYGGQTLRCLLPAEALSPVVVHEMAWGVPCVEITDVPRFAWRGLMLDCSRTFQSPEYIKKTIDRMSLFKLNVFHLHLTDDQGWRLEIKKYPKLTELGARFAPRYHEPESHEGFYTQKEMKELIEYAAERGVLIVPEIEMPGHALAALTCYPELSCQGGPFEIRPHTGHGPELFCAGNDQAFEFLENVLAEVIDLFPSPYIHIGGDEAEKDRWKVCPKCQQRMKTEGLADEEELQSYFIKRIEKFVNSRGKTIIGWEEILQGGCGRDATVMSWLGLEGGTVAAKAGHDVVMAPLTHCYFDFPYSRISTKRVYSFEPVPPALTSSEARHILGIQACFWSHIDREPNLVDRQLFPRLLAIAERGWSAKDVRDWQSFHGRLLRNLNRLAFLRIQYHFELSDAN